jgi:hypothetical protein
MKLSEHSKNRLLETFAQWDVPRDFARPMYDYLVYGFAPGSCFTSVLANDFIGAIRSSHPSNTVNAFKSLAGWIEDTVPDVARGSYEAVESWIELEPTERRVILESQRLVFAEEDEMMMVLSGVQTREPHLY